MSTNTESTMCEGMYSKLIDDESSYFDDADAKTSPDLQHHAALTVPATRGSPNQGSHSSYRLATICLAGLCAILLFSLITVGAHYANLSPAAGPQGAAQNQSEGQTEMQIQSPDVAELMESLAKLQKEKDDLEKERDQLLAQAAPVAPAVTPATQTATTASSTITCPQRWLQFNTSCYLISSFTDNWVNAKAYCEEWGGHLAIIHTPEEQTFVWNLLPRGHWNAFWFGVSDETAEEDWLWVDGTKLVGGFWEEGEPNNHIDEDCGYIVKTQKLERQAIRSWYDAPCSMHWPFICEIEIGAPKLRKQVHLN